MSDHTYNEYETIFNNVKESIRQDGAISEDALNLWFSDCRIGSVEKEKVILLAKTESRARTILTHYKRLLSEYFSAELGRKVDVDIKEAPVLTETDENEIRTVNEDPYSSTSEKIFKKGNSYTFENFVVGSSNAFAYAAAKSISEKPSTEFNPFFVYGPSGIGKTHLLYAIANRILQTRPDKVIIFLKGEDFTNALIDSLNAGTMNLFRQKYRNADVLIIDDIQFIAGKKQTQEEFFHTFDSLYENNKQIILSSDKSPSDISVLEDRLKTRFNSGLIQDIQTPDLELRLAILRKKSENAGLRLSDEILEFLADKLHSNIREIEGVIKKLSALYFLNGVEINMDTVKENISAFLKEEEPPEMTVSKIIEETGKKYGIPVEEILGRKRDKQIQLSRNVSMYIIRKITPLSLSDIGVMFERAHTSVKSNIETVNKLLESDMFLRKQIDEIIKNVKS